MVLVNLRQQLPMSTTAARYPLLQQESYAMTDSIQDRLPVPAPASNTYRVNVGGVERGPYPVEHVRELARTRELSPTDAVSYGGQPWVPATSAPGIFSDKTWTAAILLSFFLGGIGIDRFYLGYTGLGNR